MTGYFVVAFSVIIYFDKHFEMYKNKSRNIIINKNDVKYVLQDLKYFSIGVVADRFQG